MSFGFIFQKRFAAKIFSIFSNIQLLWIDEWRRWGDDKYKIEWFIHPRACVFNSIHFLPFDGTQQVSFTLEFCSALFSLCFFLGLFFPLCLLIQWAQDLCSPGCLAWVQGPFLLLSSKDQSHERMAYLNKKRFSMNCF